MYGIQVRWATLSLRQLLAFDELLYTLVQGTFSWGNVNTCSPGCCLDDEADVKLLLQTLAHDRKVHSLSSYIPKHPCNILLGEKKDPEAKPRAACFLLGRAVLCVVAQSCLTLCNTEDCSPPGSSVHGILQARILEWVAMPSSRGSSQPRDRAQVSRIAGGFFTV